MIRGSGATLLAGNLLSFLSCHASPGTSEEGVSPRENPSPFRISLNTSTISGYKLPVREQIELCAETGFDGIELWVRDVETYMAEGGTPEEIARLLKDSNLILENMISFSDWIADDPDKREEGCRNMQKDMELTARLGGKYIAAPVQGLIMFDRSKLPEYAERYTKILEAGDQTGVIPILELWGTGHLNQLSDTLHIVTGTLHPKATILLDFYHLYRGGNSFDSLHLVNGSALPVFHINDYPATPERIRLNDSDRVFPGDGICPFDELLPVLYKSGFRGGLSVELFNRTYWEEMDVRTVLKQSYEKTVRVIRKGIQ